uniref:Uncharacterized protein n=2 Tax=Vibrio TaxID=662 RepID=A0A0H3ZJN0_9VIBR|nr:hypothetical protein [Vibrio tasmaniensis]AKN40835.1 hypothetical protein [Vibrio sp. 1F_189]
MINIRQLVWRPYSLLFKAAHQFTHNAFMLELTQLPTACWREQCVTSHKFHYVNIGVMPPSLGDGG